MFKAEVYVAFGTGGYAACYQKYAAGTGTAMSRSPKTALRLATQRAERQAEARMVAEHACLYMPVLRTVRLWRGQELILDD
jgi:hypothetical protein